MHHRSRAGRGQSWSRQITSGRGAAAVAAGVLAALLGPAIPSQAASTGTRVEAAVAASSVGDAGRAVGTPSSAGQFIVRARPGRLDDVIAVLRADGYALGRRIKLIDAVVATLPAGAADTLRAAPGVASVTADAAVSLMGATGTTTTSTYDPVADANSLYNSETTTKVRNMWQKGITGKGIDVALIDSGVAPVAGLSEAGKIVNGPDLTPESQNASTRYRDTYGHGTHMAGIIAGHDAGVASPRPRRTPPASWGWRRTPGSYR
jgi:serine protease AprX